MLLGVADGDTREEAERLAGKVARLRIFQNEEGKFDRSLVDVDGEALVVSQFTLIAEQRRRELVPASPAPLRRTLPSRFTRPSATRSRRKVLLVARGVFAARMEVELVNDGPVTIILDL